MSLLGTINDGSAAWKAMLGEYVDGAGDIIDGALGSTVVVDVHQPQIGFVCFAPDAMVREQFGVVGTPEAAAAKASKPKLDASYAIRLAILGETMEARDLTACNKLDRASLEALYAVATETDEFKRGLVPEVRLGRVDATNPKYPAETRWAPRFDVLGWVANPWLANPSTVAPPEPAATEMTVEEMTKTYSDLPRNPDGTLDYLAAIRRKTTTGVAA